MDTGARPLVGEHAYGLFCVDWRQETVESWLHRFISATEVPARSAPPGISAASSTRPYAKPWRTGGIREPSPPVR